MHESPNELQSADELHVSVGAEETFLCVEIRSRNAPISCEWTHEECDNGRTLPIARSLTCFQLHVDQVTVLDLSNCKLMDLPDDCDLINLKTLNLSQNLFRQVPTCLARGCRSLHNLDLSHNALEVFDIEPRCVHKLEILRLNHNRLVNLPQWILLVKAFNLTELYYSHNKITDLNCSRYRSTSMHTLAKLQLNNCFVRDEDLSFLKSVFSLKMLDLSNTNAIDANVFDVELLLGKPEWARTIRHLNLNNLGISVLSDAAIAALVALEELHLSQNSLHWLPHSIVDLTQLRVLNIEQNSIQQLPCNFHQLTELRVLRAAHNMIGSIADLDHLTNLTYLDLYKNEIEEVPIPLIDRIDSIDLEQNYCDTQQLARTTNYEEKRKKLQATEQQRANGVRVRPCQLGLPVNHSFSDSDSDNDELNTHDNDTLIENGEFPPEEPMWDNVCKKGDGDITDDDWIGFELKPKKVKTPSQRSAIPSNNFELYCDVIE